MIDRDAFIENFRLTSCFNAIKWLVMKSPKWENTSNDKRCRIIVPEKVIKFALVQSLAFLSSKNHDDIEEKNEEIFCTESNWNWFIGWTYHFKEERCRFPEWRYYLEECRKISEGLEKVWPQWSIDGDRNVWILKPAARSRGQGITISESLPEILGLIRSSHDTRYVIQKYIERPLLIEGTKFDIRQWFLVTDYNPLTMWMYRDSYLRFCSVPYTLDNKDVSVHLCNNSIQCNYLRSSNRLVTLPEGNMLTNEDFKNLLTKRGYPDAWNDVIYPGMRSAIISVLVGSQEQMMGRKNCFELYGADFMVDEHLHPWLIEINSSPCLSPSTPVTKKLCANVIDDIFKVVLDRRTNKDCSTGNFELGYEADPILLPELNTLRLSLVGTEFGKCCLTLRDYDRSNGNQIPVKNPRFKNSSKNLVPWQTSKIFKNLRGRRLFYMERIVNDIKNKTKSSHYSLCEGIHFATSNYIVPNLGNFQTFQKLDSGKKYSERSNEKIISFNKLKKGIKAGVNFKKIKEMRHEENNAKIEEKCDVAENQEITTIKCEIRKVETTTRNGKIQNIRSKNKKDLQLVKQMDREQEPGISEEEVTETKISNLRKGLIVLNENGSIPSRKKKLNQRRNLIKQTNEPDKEEYHTSIRNRTKYKKLSDVPISDNCSKSFGTRSKTLPSITTKKTTKGKIVCN